MFKKFYGETEEIQFNFLKKRLITSVIVTVVYMIVIGLLAREELATAILIPLFVWGWPAAKVLFGVSTFASMFSKNIGLAVILFFLSFLITPFIGIAFMFIGVFRFIYLLVKRLKNGKKNL